MKTAHPRTMQQILESIDLGNGAMQRNDFDSACQHFYAGAKALLLIAKQSHGETQIRQLKQASALMHYAHNLENDLENKLEDSTVIINSGSDDISDNAMALPKSKSNNGITFDHVIGADDAIKFLKAKVIHPLQYPEQAAKFKQQSGGGILLYGPPGTGKTLLVKALSNEINAPVFAIKPSDILGKYVGESEQNLSKLFEDARSHPLSIIFVDEMDALAPQRGNDNNANSERLVNQLLQELDGFDSQDNTLLFVGASNLPWKIDTALLRGARVDLMCYIGLPEVEGRLKLLELYLDEIPIESDINLMDIAEKTHLFSAADIMNLCNQASQLTFMDNIENAIDRDVSQQDLEQAMLNIKPSATLEMLQQYKEFK